MGRSCLIRIVPFGDAAPDGLVQALNELGYEASLNVGDDWLRAPRDDGSSTALFLSSDRDHGRILRHLHGLPDPAVLGVFHRPAIAPDHQIAAACRDFVVWPCSNDELSTRLALLRAGASSEDARPSEAALTGEDSSQLKELRMIGQSDNFLRVLRALKKVGASSAPVLVYGETGTGKEIAARAVHYLSPRRNCAFIPANCGALPEQLIENELFGHQRGAYTDAKENQVGLVEQADGGTLFLDEVGNLNMKGQCALLRFLQNQEFKRLGSHQVRRADVRVVAATNANLPAMVKAGTFREDLLYRLNIVSVVVPPLRDRPGDALMLADHFLAELLRQYGTGPVRFSQKSAEWVERYHWPGNVRELENLIHREFLLAEGATIHIGSGESDSCSNPSAEQRPVAISRFRLAKARVVNDFEREYLADLLDRTSGNLSEAARLAGKERRGFARLLKKHGLERATFDR
jgi:DNA-binding NtrC family response regulator